MDGHTQDQFHRYAFCSICGRAALRKIAYLFNSQSSARQSYTDDCELGFII